MATSITSSNKIKAPKSKMVRWLFIVGLLWLAIALFFWMTRVYASPENVWKGMIQNNFTTQGYTRLVKNEAPGVRQSEISQVQYGIEPVARTNVTIERVTSTEVAQVISTPKQDFVRYTELDYVNAKGKPIDMSDAIDKWAVQTNAGQLSQSFSQLILFGTYFPMTNVDAQERNKLLKFIDTNPVYTPNFDTVKSESVNGHNVFTYEVSIELQDYAKMVKDLGEAIGLSEKVSGLNPDDYVKQEPVKLIVSVDKVSKRIVAVQYPNNAEVSERYDGYGIHDKPLMLPEDPITTIELQQIILKNTSGQKQ